MGNLLRCCLRSNPKTSSYYDDIPEHVVLQEILPRLPSKSLARFKYVSKNWYRSISDEPFFLSAYLGRRPHMSKISNIVLVERSELAYKPTKFDAIVLLAEQEKAIEFGRDLSPFLPKLGYGDCDKFIILGTCHGLILLLRRFSICLKDSIILFNPTTMEIRVLPDPIPFFEDDLDYIVPTQILNLGFDKKRREHKVVKIVETWELKGDSQGSERFLCVQVISKNSKIWRRSERIPGYLLLDFKQTVSLDGVLYFLASRTCAKNERDCILSFDFSDDKVRNIIDIPGYNSSGVVTPNYGLILVKWKENSLGLISFVGVSQERIKFFVMDKNPHSSCVFWTELFTLDFPYEIHYCGVLKDQFLFKRWNFYSGKLEYFICKTEDSKVEYASPIFAQVERTSEISLVHDYTPSLVSPFPTIFEREI